MPTRLNLFCHECRHRCIQIETSRAPYCARCRSEFVQVESYADPPEPETKTPVPDWVSVVHTLQQIANHPPVVQFFTTVRTDPVGALAQALHASLVIHPGSRDRPTTEAGLARLECFPAPASGSILSRSCVVCLEAFEAEQPLAQLPCDHIYHEACIRPWLARQHTCPVCRAKIG